MFAEAVAAIDAGDLGALRALLPSTPTADERLENGRDDYFARPYLLWFVAENPIRNGTLPANIVEVTRVLLERGAEGRDYALALVVSGQVLARVRRAARPDRRAGRRAARTRTASIPRSRTARTPPRSGCWSAARARRSSPRSASAARTRSTARRPRSARSPSPAPRCTAAPTRSATAHRGRRNRRLQPARLALALDRAAQRRRLRQGRGGATSWSPPAPTARSRTRSSTPPRDGWCQLYLKGSDPFMLRVAGRPGRRSSGRGRS